jgi:hypothetical protein
MALAPQQVAQMLGVAGWMPAIATACWQVNRRQWLALLSSDLITSIFLRLLQARFTYPSFYLMLCGFFPLLCCHGDV